MCTENCPDHNQSLSSWNPGHQPEKAVVVRSGELFRLDSSATFHSVTIQSGGKHIKVYDILISIVTSADSHIINMPTIVTYSSEELMSVFL